MLCGLLVIGYFSLILELRAFTLDTFPYRARKEMKVHQACASGRLLVYGQPLFTLPFSRKPVQIQLVGKTSIY